MPTIAYAGTRYPVSLDTIHDVVAKLQAIQRLPAPTAADLFEIPVLDGRYVVLNLSHSVAIAFERAADDAEANLQRE